MWKRKKKQKLYALLERQMEGGFHMIFCNLWCQVRNSWAGHAQGMYWFPSAWMPARVDAGAVLWRPLSHQAWLIVANRCQGSPLLTQSWGGLSGLWSRERVQGVTPSPIVQQLQLQRILTYFGGQHSTILKLFVHDAPLSLQLLLLSLEGLNLFCDLDFILSGAALKLRALLRQLLVQQVQASWYFQTICA